MHSGPRPSTLVSLLEQRAALTPDQTAFIFLRDGQKEELPMTFAELVTRSKQIAGALVPLVKPGERVLINHSPGLEYIASFFGCLYAGAIAVPVYPPRFNAKLDRLNAVAEDADAKVALTSSSIHNNLEPFLPQNPALAAVHWIDTELVTTPPSEGRPDLAGRDTLAFMQYTSGSTSRPKGVMLTHGNLLANLDCIHRYFEMGPNETAVSWLPPYHDMGLIGCILEPIYAGVKMVFFSPYAFAQRPIRWLRAITKYQARVSGAPNFAYDLCVQRVTDEQAAELDLSSWRLAFCGAEPIRPDVLERFTAKFAPRGFRRETFYPCYGLAEASLIVTGGKPVEAPIVAEIDVDTLESKHVAETATAATKRPRKLVGCGKPLDCHTLKIVDPESRRECPEGTVGEVWFSGPSVAQGYWNRPRETEASFAAHLADPADGKSYLRTGDLGFLRDGELFVTSRIKDLIIIRGRNLYPNDIELSVEQSHEHLRAGAGAAFSILEDDEERLVIVQELERTSREANLDEVIEAIRTRMMEDHGLQPFAISLVRANTIPLTSSGKIQRHASRDLFLKGELIERKRYVDVPTT